MVTTPTVHLNGTSGEVLYEENREAIRAIDKAISALSRAAPNGRDYHMRGAMIADKAFVEHNTRMAKLREIRKELEEIGLSIIDQDWQ